MKRRLIALLGVLALAVAACGGGDDDTSASDDDSASTDDDGSSRRTTSTEGDGGRGDGDVEAYCELRAEGDALEADLGDEPTPEALEEYFDEQRALIDQALEVVPDEIAEELQDDFDAFDEVIEAAENANFDITDPDLIDTLNEIGDRLSEHRAVLKEFADENCDGGGSDGSGGDDTTGGGGFSTSSTVPGDDPVGDPEPVSSDGDIVAYCASVTASAALTLPDDPSPRQFKQYLLTQDALVLDAYATVPEEIVDEYTVFVRAFSDLVVAAEEAAFDINDPGVIEAVDTLIADTEIVAVTETVDAFNAATCDGDIVAVGDGDPLALCAADETLNLLVDDLFSATDPEDVEAALFDLISLLGESVPNAPTEVRPDVEVLLGAFEVLDGEAVLVGYDLADPELLESVQAIFGEPSVLEASDNLVAWVGANCDTGVGDPSADLAPISALCSGGNLFACDVLFTTSDIASAEEGLALACGGSAMVGGGGECFDESPFLRTGSSPEMDAVTDLCVAGNGQACYGLYINSAIGSDYELVGATCDFEQNEGDDPFNCVTGDFGA